MIHTTIGVYPDGSRKANGVESEGIAEHIQYNIMFRPGRALFLDGKCIHRGMGVVADWRALEKELSQIKFEQDTKPYV